MIKYKKIITAALISAMLMTGCSSADNSSTATDNGSTEVSTTTNSTVSSGQNTSGNSSSSNESSDNPAGSGDTSASTVSAITSVDTSEMFTNRDKEIGYDESTSVKLVLSGDNISSSSDSVTVSGSTATISEEGTYIISGTLDDGMIIIDADKSAKIQLVLDNANINSNTSAAIYVCKADKVFITLAPGSENTLSNGGEYTAIDDNNIDAVIFSRMT